MKRRPAGWVLFLAGLLFLVVGCADNTSPGDPTPFPTVTTAPTRTPSPTPAPTGTPAGITKHTILPGNFSLLLPGDWDVVPAGLTPLGYYFQLGPRPVGPGPFSSSIFVANAADLSTIAAAEQLLCGDGCADDLEFEDTFVGGEPAVSTVLQSGDMPALTWIFVERDDQLLILSIHDPVTLENRPDLLDTIEFIAATPSAEATSPPTVTPTSTPVPTLDPIISWQRASPPDTGLSFEVPADWIENQENYIWSPIVAPGLAVEFNWQADSGPSLAADDFFPAGAEELSSAPFILPWSTNAISYTVALDTGLASYVVVPAGDRTFAFGITAPNAQSLAAFQPVLTHLLESVRLDFIIEPVIVEPADATIGFFQALINDEPDESLLAFLTPRLRAEIPAGESPFTLLQLEDRLIEYNLDWEFITSNSVLVTMLITLQNGMEVNRTMTVVNLGDVGWRIDEVNNPSPEE